MILKDACWVWSVNLENKLEDSDSVGKWLFWAPKPYLVEVFPKIDALVEEGKIYKAKYAHRGYPTTDSFWNGNPVLCVYADDNTKDTTLTELSKLGVNSVEWKYDSQTKIDRKLGGVLYKKSERAIEEYLIKELIRNSDKNF